MNIKQELQNKINNKTKPLGSLGRLEELAMQIGLIQQTTTPAVDKPHFYVFASDHGISEAGVSLFPKEVTQQMVLNFLNGGAAINVFCKQHQIPLKVVDAGVDADFDNHPELINAKVRKSTHNMLQLPAMEVDECMQALETGKKMASDAKAKGCNLIACGEMGIGNTSSASLLMSVFCNLPIEACTGRGTGFDRNGILKKTKILQDVLLKHKTIAEKGTALEKLSCFGGFEIAMMAGLYTKAKELNMVILADGFISGAAMLAADALEPGTAAYAIYSHQSDEAGHALMLEKLNAKALLNLHMRLGEGTGAAVAYPIIVSAVEFLNNMASFESAGVSQS